MRNYSRIALMLMVAAILFTGCKKEIKPGRVYKWTGDGQRGLANRDLGTPISVRAESFDGVWMSDVEVEFNVTQGGGTVDNPVVTTDENGFAQVKWRLGASGTQVLSVEVKDKKGNAVGETPVVFTAELNIQGTFTDPRDGQEYATLTVGNQTWLAENLRYNAIGSQTNPAYPDPVYGRQYPWAIARIACPAGWHLPSDDEWNILETALGCCENGELVTQLFSRGLHAVNMKSDIGWLNDGNGTNGTGFNVYPAGYYDAFTAVIYSTGLFADFWTSTEYDSNEGFFRRLSFDSDGVSRLRARKIDGSSCRCVQD